MSDAQRDDNQVVVMIAEDPDGNPAPVLIDHTTGYVLVDVTAVSDVVPSVLPDRALHDKNGVRSMTGENTGEPLALLMDDSTGLLWIDS